jgi:hypothetical protein
MFGFIDSSGSARDAMALTRNPFVRTSGAAGLRELNVDSSRPVSAKGGHSRRYGQRAKST